MAGTEKVNLESYDSYNNEQFIPLLQCLQVAFSIYQDLRKDGGAGGVRGVGGSYKIVRTICFHQYKGFGKEVFNTTSAWSFITWIKKHDQENGAKHSVKYQITQTK